MKFKKDEIYQLVFDDHSLGDMGVIACKVIGWVVHDGHKAVTLAYWIPVTNDKKIREDNMERMNILKSTILSWTLLS